MAGPASTSVDFYGWCTLVDHASEIEAIRLGDQIWQVLPDGGLQRDDFCEFRSDDFCSEPLARVRVTYHDAGPDGFCGYEITDAVDGFLWGAVGKWIEWGSLPDPHIRFTYHPRVQALLSLPQPEFLIALAAMNQELRDLTHKP